MTLWIDLDHTPHVPLFRPIIEELHRRNIETLVTARDFAQTVALLEMWNIPHVTIGRHGGSSKVGKVLNLFERSSQLIAYAWNKKIDLAVSHGSRTMLTACKLLRIPAVTMMDYEYTEVGIFNALSKYLLIPEYIPENRLKPNGFKMEKVIRYPGYKEELYLPYFKPDPDFRASIGVPEGKTLVTIRPSAMYANYHDPLSEQILLKVIEKALESPDAWPLIVSRIEKDKNFIRERFGARANFLEKAVDGLQLIWNSDVFISGGGTMNREAGLLGVPVYSIFTGRKPYLDEYLAGQGRLTFIDTPEKVGLVEIKARDRKSEFRCKNPGLTKEVVDILVRLGSGV
jgi:predicted glycosyltransferase